MQRTLVAAGAVLALGGCASMSKQECVSADWRAVGYEDGAAGLPVSAVSNRRKACADKAGVTVDMAAYRAGRAEGLALFCRPDNGFALGERGGAYAGVCAGPDADLFAHAYETGRSLWRLEKAVAAVGGQIQQARYDLRDVEHAIAETEVSLVAPGFSAQERIALLAELRQLSQERGDIEAALDGLHRDLDLAQAELADYRDALAFNGGWRGVSGLSEARY